MNKLKVILIDDNDAFRQAFKLYLTKQFNVEVIAEASNEHQINEIKQWPIADIIFMDVMMPEKSGIQLTKELIWQYSRLNIIAITMHIDSVYLKSLIEAGFRGCIFKDRLVNQIEEAIEEVNKGKLYFPENIMLDNNKIK